MDYRTITKTVTKNVVMKLQWEVITKTRKAYPHETFVVHALFQSDGDGANKEMLGYVVKDSIGYWSIYFGDQRYARTANIGVSKNLQQQKKRLMEHMAD
ncbi:hypothetical protein LCGC14_1864460 [marine sediment metagenome]|uniref:Uncharacterized protein n=1 Tax=marine sediment metagenome TaxID=412755 RepID=A0A0F9IL10_9ZZZZ